MKVNCTSCGYEVNLSHTAFKDYVGPVKCFCCSSMMEIKIAEGFVYSVNPLAIAEAHPTNNPAENSRCISD